LTYLTFRGTQLEDFVTYLLLFCWLISAILLFPVLFVLLAVLPFTFEQQAL